MHAMPSIHWPGVHPSWCAGAGNASLAAHKKQAEQMEAQQDARILEYQLQKDRREQVASLTAHVGTFLT